MSDGALTRAVETYLCDLKDVYADAERTGQATAELSYRPALHSFFQEVMQILNVPDASVIHEPNKQYGKGYPDWLFQNRRSMGVYGYAEAKGFNYAETFDWEQHSKQISRYLSIGHRLMLTDGADFFLFRPRRVLPERLTLIGKPLRLDSEWKSTASSASVRSFFSSFFQKPAATPVTDARLVETLAIRARNMAEEIKLLVSLDPGEGTSSIETDTITALRSIKKTLVAEYDPLLNSDEMFSKAISQILIFGAFYAHRHLYGSVKPADLKNRLASFWTGDITTDSENKLKPFRALAAILGKQEKSLSGINLWYSDCILYLSHVKLSETQQESPDYHDLYERFLEQLDPQDKIDFGSYATPSDLARFMVGFAEYISSTVFGSSLFTRGNKIVEPCCGTGTFLEVIIKEATRQKINANHLPAIAGFEILAAPYALTQYRLHQLGKRYPLASYIRTLLCNTLSDRVVGIGSIQEALVRAQTLFDDEVREAVAAANPPITLVIGNPPSSDAGMEHNRQKAISGLVDDFRPPKSERKSRQNVQKQMQNDFVKFLRWACHKVDSDKRGIVAYVLPSSFLRHVSYKFARKWVFQNFSEIWVIEMDKDARTGARTSNVFHTLQGRCVLFCAKTASSQAATVRYVSIMDMGSGEKMQWFKLMLTRIRQRSDISEFFSELPATDAYAFKPSPPCDKGQYDKFWNLTRRDSKSCIFERHSSGVKLGLTAALTHLDEGQLSRRIKDIADMKKSYADLIERWFKGQSRPPSNRNMSAEVRVSIMKAASKVEKHIRNYSFRPFMASFAFLSEEALQKARAERWGWNKTSAGDTGSIFRSQQLWNISCAFDRRSKRRAATLLFVLLERSRQ